MTDTKKAQIVFEIDRKKAKELLGQAKATTEAIEGTAVGISKCLSLLASVVESAGVFLREPPEEEGGRDKR